MHYWVISKNNELYHHGILGQKWGKRNGPPYPLDAKDHSAAEKKAGWRKSLDNDGTSGKYARKYKKLLKKQSQKYIDLTGERLDNELRKKALNKKIDKAASKGNEDKAQKYKEKLKVENQKTKDYKNALKELEKERIAIVKEANDKGYVVSSKQLYGATTKERRGYIATMMVLGGGAIPTVGYNIGRNVMNNVAYKGLMSVVDERTGKTIDLTPSRIAYDNYRVGKKDSKVSKRYTRRYD